ncbi:cancer-related nucleoside-triphosphatase isoform X5 [Oratosquilla oratoria]|uniref:cancer-related nucleoside-triphosphatase isoform X5 n=1 Tax=Oratosquilla oratoria TaxID=337810 RepID=UPI003F758AF8
MPCFGCSAGFQKVLEKQPWYRKLSQSYRRRTFIVKDFTLKRPDNGSHGCRVGQYVVDVPAFESLALPVVRTAKISKGQVLVLDEIGKMEMFSKEFVASVKQLINSPGYTILTTIPVSKGKPIPLVEHIRSHADVMVVQLSRENRNDPAIHEQIISTLMSSLSS